MTRLLSVRPLTWIGDRSYSWYLWQWPFIVWAKALWPGAGAAAPLAAALSLLPAWASYRYVENPIRFGPRFRGRPVLALGAVCVLVPAAASAGLLGAHGALWRTSAMQEWEHAERLHADVVRGCESDTPLGQRPASCTWTVPNAKGRVALVGDSTAGQLTEPFVRGANEAGYDATVVTLNNCPFVDVAVVGILEEEGGCRRFVHGTMADLTRRPPSLVVTAALTTSYVETARVRLRAADGHLVGGADGKARLWQRGLGATLAQLNRAGVPVVVVHPTPDFPFGTDNCAMVRVLLRRCTATISREEVRKRRRRSLAAERAAIASAPRAVGLDLVDDICGARSCSTRRDGFWLYRDRRHLSVEGALTLTGRFREAIQAHTTPRR